MSESSDAATSCGSRPGNGNLSNTSLLGGPDNTTATGANWSNGAKQDTSGCATAVTQHSNETGSAFQKYVRKENPSALKTEGNSHNSERYEGQQSMLPESASARSADLQQTTKNSKQSTSTGIDDCRKTMATDSDSPSGDCGDDSDNDLEPGSTGKDTTSGKGRKNKHSSMGDDDEDHNGKSKKQRLIWTPELHARFLNAVNHLGVKNAVPKTILQLMNVEGMTRENVASHLQKYRLYLKRLAGLPANAPLSAETLQQVQNVQQAMQQQVQAGFQKNQAAALQLGAAGMPTVSLAAAMPAVSLTQNYQELVNQLMASAGASNSAAAAAAASNGLQASTLSALQRQALLSVGVLPGILPMGVIPVTMGGFGGINPTLLAGGTIGLVSGLGGSAGAGHHIMLPGANMGMHLAAQLGAGNQGLQ